MIKSIRVLGKSVAVVCGPVSGDDYGECDHVGAKLLVSLKQSADMRRDTVLHELLHFIDEEMQLKMRERQIRMTATVLLGVMRDNPKLVTYLMDG